MTLSVEQFICRSDNFCVLVHDDEAKLTVSIDAPQEGPIRDALKRTGWKLTHIFTTHHHGDHVEANEALKRDFGCEITGPKAEASKIPGIDRTVGDGDTFMFGNREVRVLTTPGHTAGHVVYHIPSANLLFAGDTLFSLGCGRLFEEGPDKMQPSLEKLTRLPPQTVIYCGHEYTLSNARFALTVDPGNAALQARAKEVEQLRAAGRMTLPTRLDAELATNPFLRWSDPAIRKTLGMEHASDTAVFSEIRRRKDSF